MLVAIAQQEGIGHGEVEIVAVDGLYLRDWPALLEDIRKQYPELSLTFLQIERTRSRARQLNVGIDLAKADLLLLLADDFIPRANLVSDHLKAHEEDPREELVAIGPGLFPEGDRSNAFMKWLEDSGELFGVSFTLPAAALPPYYFYMANTSLKRSFLEKAGRFDESFPYDAMDDWEMGIRLHALGMKNVYLPGAIAIHEHIIDLPERCRAMEQAGESSAIYDSKRQRPGPWVRLLEQPRVKHSARKRESREQRYRRILREHWVKGYRSYEQAAQ
jgi:GT2 family glycosyltransferase